MNIQLRVLLIGSIFLFSCKDQEYKNLKNDFGIRQIPCEDIRYFSEGTIQGLNRTMYFAIDCTADSLNKDQLKLVRRRLSMIVDTINMEKYTTFSVLFLKEGQTLSEIEKCNAATLVKILSTKRHRFVKYAYRNGIPGKMLETGYDCRGIINASSKEIELDNFRGDDLTAKSLE